MRHFVILEDNRYEGRMWDTPIGDDGIDWIEVEIAPTSSKDTWNGAGWTPYVEPLYPSVAIITSPNGTPYKIKVDDNGNLLTETLEE